MSRVARTIVIGIGLGFAGGLIAGAMSGMWYATALVTAVFISGGVLVGWALAQRAMDERTAQITMAQRMLAAHLAQGAPSQGGKTTEGDGASFSLPATLDRLLVDMRRFGADRQLMQDVLEHMAIGVMAVDHERRVVFENRRMVEIMRGRSAVGRSPLEALRNAAIHEAIARAIAAGDIQRTQCELHDGATYAVTVAPTSAAVGGPAAVVIWHDISEWVGAETARRDMVANVSHELRTPVASISGFAETLLQQQQLDPDKTRRFLEIILRNANRMSDMIARLLDLSRLDAGRWPLAPEALSAEKIVGAVTRQLHAKAEAKGVHIDTRVDPGSIAYADPTGFDHVLLNLLENAVKYSDVGRIEVRVTNTDDGMIRFEVADNGPGIPERYHERIFERFFRVDKGRSRDAGGYGLGLSIAKNLVVRMGGKIGVRNGDERGAVFWFTLPQPTASQSDGDEAYIDEAPEAVETATAMPMTGDARASLR